MPRYCCSQPLLREPVVLGGSTDYARLFAFRSDSDLAQPAALRAGFGISPFGFLCACEPPVITSHVIAAALAVAKLHTTTRFTEGPMDPVKFNRRQLFVGAATTAAALSFF